MPLLCFRGQSVPMCPEYGVTYLSGRTSVNQRIGHPFQPVTVFRRPSISAWETAWHLCVEGLGESWRELNPGRCTDQTPAIRLEDAREMACSESSSGTRLRPGADQTSTRRIAGACC